MTNDDASTILVVEDDDTTRTFLADNLSADGYDLLTADCAADALGLLERKFPDLALIDLNLPDASGFDLLRRVRSSDGVISRVDPDTPLLVVSGRSSELDRVRGFDRGADDYVCKPFSYPELRGSLVPNRWFLSCLLLQGIGTVHRRVISDAREARSGLFPRVRRVRSGRDCLGVSAGI